VAVDDPPHVARLMRAQNISGVGGFPVWLEQPLCRLQGGDELLLVGAVELVHHSRDRLARAGVDRRVERAAGL